MDRTLEMVTRYGKLAVCLALAAVAIWRANDYVDPKGPTMMPAIMCSLFAMVMTFTGFALTTREQE
jgi:membrane glycosyltransferase